MDLGTIKMNSLSLPWARSNEGKQLTPPPGPSSATPQKSLSPKNEAKNKLKVASPQNEAKNKLKLNVAQGASNEPQPRDGMLKRLKNKRGENQKRDNIAVRLDALARPPAGKGDSGTVVTDPGAFRKVKNDRGVLRSASSHSRSSDNSPKARKPKKGVSPSRRPCAPDPDGILAAAPTPVVRKHKTKESALPAAPRLESGGSSSHKEHGVSRKPETTSKPATLVVKKDKTNESVLPVGSSSHEEHDVSRKPETTSKPATLVVKKDKTNESALPIDSSGHEEHDVSCTPETSSKQVSEPIGEQTAGPPTGLCMPSQDEPSEPAPIGEHSISQDESPVKSGRLVSSRTVGRPGVRGGRSRSRTRHDASTENSTDESARRGRSRNTPRRDDASVSSCPVTRGTSRTRRPRSVSRGRTCSAANGPPVAKPLVSKRRDIPKSNISDESKNVVAADETADEEAAVEYDFDDGDDVLLKKSGHKGKKAVQFKPNFAEQGWASEHREPRRRSMSIGHVKDCLKEELISGGGPPSRPELQRSYSDRSLRRIKIEFLLETPLVDDNKKSSYSIPKQKKHSGSNSSETTKAVSISSSENGACHQLGPNGIGRMNEEEAANQKSPERKRAAFSVRGLFRRPRSDTKFLHCPD